VELPVNCSYPAHVSVSELIYLAFESNANSYQIVDLTKLCAQKLLPLSRSRGTIPQNFLNRIASAPRGTLCAITLQLALKQVAYRFLEELFLMAQPSNNIVHTIKD